MENTPHYYLLKSGRDVADVIEELDFGTGFRLGNVIKYISRAGRKSSEDAVSDLKKARSYIDEEIKCREAFVKQFTRLYEETADIDPESSIRGTEESR